MMMKKNHENERSSKITDPRLIAERDEVGLCLTMIVPGSTYDKGTGMWDFSGNKEFAQAILKKEH